MVENAHANSPQSQEKKVIDREMIGKPAKGIGKGLLRDIKELSVTQTNNQYYLQDTTRGAKIITMDGQRRDVDDNVLPKPIIWLDADNIT
ncbi:hypothetical protein [Bacillus toyonensis]|uniref:hypothetical protein n=1 Tax=Bacillus toyonensis TaxID=155322 RepID=UPI002175710A|nr:hypothetical protein [Bacillus toyonensis]